MDTQSAANSELIDLKIISAQIAIPLIMMGNSE